MQRRLPTLGAPGATVVRYFVSDGLSSAKEIGLSVPHRPSYGIYSFLLVSNKSFCFCGNTTESSTETASIPTIVSSE